MFAASWDRTSRSYVYRFIAVSEESAASILSVVIIFFYFSSDCSNTSFGKFIGSLPNYTVSNRTKQRRR